MQTIVLLKRLDEKAVFTIQDIKRIANCNSSYAKQIISRLHKKGFAKKITKNKYTTKDDIHAIASNIIFPSYISFWSASSLLGYTDQILNTITLATTRKIKPLRYESYVIKSINIKKYFFGYHKLRTANGELFIVDNEKLIIDVLLRPRECGNFDEIRSIIEKSEITEEKMVGYLKRVNNQAMIKRAGFLIEEIRGVDLSKYFTLDRNYVTLNPLGNKTQMINTKWRIKT